MAAPRTKDVDNVIKTIQRFRQNGIHPTRVVIEGKRIEVELPEGKAEPADPYAAADLSR